jgi:mannose-6-phosphate isomerase
VPYAYGYHNILSSEYFHLARYDLAGEPLFGDTRGESFHIVTAIDGAVSVTTDHAQATLGQYETLIIPAETHAYHLQAGKKGEALVAHVPA